MPDNVDFIQEQQAELLERQINAARVKHCGASALVCEECDAPIPALMTRCSSLKTTPAPRRCWPTRWLRRTCGRWTSPSLQR